MVLAPIFILLKKTVNISIKQIRIYFNLILRICTQINQVKRLSRIIKKEEEPHSTQPTVAQGKNSKNLLEADPFQMIQRKELVISLTFYILVTVVDS